MGKNCLSSKGLSISQSQSISNLCHQRSREISVRLENCNNYSKTVEVDGKSYLETPGNPLPSHEEVTNLLTEKSRLHATQAFLMENIRAKDSLIKSIKSENFDYSDSEERPSREDLEDFYPEDLVDESWGWDQLTPSEYNKFLEAEAFASHIGQFIHKGGSLDKLRADLPNTKTLQWMEIEAGKKTPVVVNLHHKSEDLLSLHESLSSLHRKYEQEVNYFKAKVKNLVTKRNSEISSSNSKGQMEVNKRNEGILEDYQKKIKEWQGRSIKASHDFENERQKRISEASEMRIDVDSRFQETVDLFLKTIE